MKLLQAKPSGRDAHDPSPEDIRRRCMTIQREWTPAERLHRRTVQLPSWLAALTRSEN